MRKRSMHSAPYEPPVTPASWGTDARMFAQRVKQLFDDLFSQSHAAEKKLKMLPDELTRQLADSVFPIGSIYEANAVSNCPSNRFPWQTWEEYMPGRVLVGAGAADYGTAFESGAIGGEMDHTLTVEEIPSHAHKFPRQQWYSNDVEDAGTNATIYSWKTTTGGSTSKRYTSNNDARYGRAGGSSSHNNMQPYAVIYRWIRIK